MGSGAWPPAPDAASGGQKRSAPTAPSGWLSERPDAGGSSWETTAVTATPAGVPAWEPAEEQTLFQPTQAAHPLPLYLAVISALAGLVIGLVFGRVLGWVSAIGWLLGGVVTVGLVAVYQAADLRDSSSMWHVPDPAAKVIRLLALGLGAVAVVVNTFHLAYWLATR